MFNFQLPEQTPKRRPRYLDVMPERMKETYLNELDRLARGEYSMPEVEAFLEANRPPNKVKKRK